MIRRQLPVINKLGLHARAATKLASAAAHHQCAVRTTALLANYFGEGE